MRHRHQALQRGISLDPTTTTAKTFSPLLSLHFNAACSYANCSKRYQNVASSAVVKPHVILSYNSMSHTYPGWSNIFHRVQRKYKVCRSIHLLLRWWRPLDQHLRDNAVKPSTCQLICLFVCLFVVQNHAMSSCRDDVRDDVTSQTPIANKTKWDTQEACIVSVVNQEFRSANIF